MIEFTPKEELVGALAQFLSTFPPGASPYHTASMVIGWLVRVGALKLETRLVVPEVSVSDSTGLPLVEDVAPGQNVLRLIQSAPKAQLPENGAEILTKMVVDSLEEEL